MSLLNRLFGNRAGETQAVESPRASARHEKAAAPNGDGDADELVRNGLQHHQAGDLASAERAYRVALASAPDHADVHYLLGSLLGASGRLDAALDHLQQAARLDPTAAAARSDMGNVYRAQGRMADAEAA